jgi:hypothetical protein
MILYSEAEELQQERERLRGRWKRTAPIIMLMGSLIITAGIALILNSAQAQEFGVVFVLFGVCVCFVGLQYFYNLYTHKENSITGLRSTEA